MTLRLRLRRLLHGWTTRRRLRALTTPPTLPQQIARIHRHLEVVNRELLQASLLVQALEIPAAELRPMTSQPTTPPRPPASGIAPWPTTSAPWQAGMTTVDPAERQFVGVDYGSVPALALNPPPPMRQNPHRRRTASDLTFRDQQMPPPPGLQIWTENLAESGPAAPASTNVPRSAAPYSQRVSESNGIKSDS